MNSAWLLVVYIFFSAFAVSWWCDDHWPNLRPKSGWRVGIAVVITTWGLGWLPYLGWAIEGRTGAIILYWLQIMLMGWAIIWMLRWVITLMHDNMGGPTGGTRA